MLADLLLLATLLPTAPALQWYNISSPNERGALCNDFTPAGYFIHHEPNSTKWVLFFEGGGGCTSPQSCNIRFIDQKVRDSFTSTVNGSKVVDVAAAWRTFQSDPLQVISKLMTTHWQFAPNASRQSQLWSIEGRDLLSSNKSENPDFFSHNHVLVPYCSSDLWLQRSANYRLALKQGFNFIFDPTAASHQFTFRGAAIFRSVVEDLFKLHELDQASEVVLAGSSAGGVGVLNHAKWVQEQLERQNMRCKLSAIIDSSWFIDFQNIMAEELVKLNISHLVHSGEIVHSCSDPYNPSACLSAHQLLNNAFLYPDIPTLAITSQYDLYILIRSLQNRPMVLDLLHIVSEYGGAIITSLKSTSINFRNLSYYSTSCFQHVYLATSSLLEEGGLLAATPIAELHHNNAFRLTCTRSILDSVLPVLLFLHLSLSLPF